jgi:hypothetical protein
MSAGNRVSGVFAPGLHEGSAEKLLLTIQFLAGAQSVPAVNM